MTSLCVSSFFFGRVRNTRPNRVFTNISTRHIFPTGAVPSLESNGECASYERFDGETFPSPARLTICPPCFSIDETWGAG